jgi:hypothetical protein
MKITIRILQLTVTSCLLTSAWAQQPPTAQAPVKPAQAPAKPVPAAKLQPFDKGVRIEVRVSKSARVAGGDLDDKTQKIALKVKFSNADLHSPYENYTATVYALGQGVRNRNERKVLLQDSVLIESIPALKAMEHDCPVVTTQFDKTDATFGYAYDSWVVVVKDKDGKIVAVKSSVPAWEKLPEMADAMKSGLSYDSRTLRSLERARGE